MGVEQVEVGRRRPGWVDLHAEEPVVDVVVNGVSQVGHCGRCRVGERRKHLDESALLSNVDFARRREDDLGGLGQAGEDRLDREARRRRLEEGRGRLVADGPSGVTMLAAVGVHVDIRAIHAGRCCERRGVIACCGCGDGQKHRYYENASQEGESPVAQPNPPHSDQTLAPGRGLKGIDRERERQRGVVATLLLGYQEWVCPQAAPLP